MKAIKDIIRLWDKWQPTINYVCPSIVTTYYYDRYDIQKRRKPLFPKGEINDIAAVIAGSKPSCIINFYYEDTINLTYLQELIPIAEQQNIQYTSFQRFSTTMHIFSKNHINEEIENVIKNSDSEKLGLLLGYPKESVNKFLKTIRTILVKYGMNPPEKIYKKNSTYLRKIYGKKPPFIISNDWFK